MKMIEKNTLCKAACELERNFFLGGNHAAGPVASSLRRLITRGASYFVPQSEVDSLIENCPDESCASILRKLI